MARPQALPLVLIAVGGLAGWIALSHGPRENLASTPPPPPKQATPPARLDVPGHKTILSDWQECLSRCENGDDPAKLKQWLVTTKSRWLEEEPDVVAQTIGQLLRSGADAKTGIAFETGPGRALRGWPTMRVFLLDVLSVTDPDLAMEIAREVLTTTSSAEEFAVALKPLTFGETWRASDKELAGYFSKMLETPAWQDSVGLAEALDLSRFSRSPEIAESLAHWVDHSPTALKAGSFALHETAAEQPALVAELISTDDSLFAAQPDLRASLMARTNVSDPAQAGQVEAYLKNPEIPQSEKQRFLSLFPLRSATTGYRLYGKPPAPFQKDQVQAGDQAALAMVAAWKSDPGLANLAGDFATLEGRLQGWTKQAGN
ncbi:hypothetical protein [Luteolibacter soli]|uniref:DUF4034 domain-containing protein n=1 Tax=Luteolibacter soli TaxID=3135280 RepID=A0ABU9B1S5_9BACT